MEFEIENEHFEQKIKMFPQIVYSFKYSFFEDWKFAGEDRWRGNLREIFSIMEKQEQYIVNRFLSPRFFHPEHPINYSPNISAVMIRMGPKVFSAFARNSDGALATERKTFTSFSQNILDSICSHFRTDALKHVWQVEIIIISDANSIHVNTILFSAEINGISQLVNRCRLYFLPVSIQDVL